jgi:hypothetical protein
MSEWSSTYDAVFFISLATLIFGFLGLIVRYALKSKCEHFKCCFGLFEIDRRVDLEVQEELAQMELGGEHNDISSGNDEDNKQAIRIQDSRKNLKKKECDDESKV